VKVRPVPTVSSTGGITVHRAAWVIEDPWHIHRDGFVQVERGRIQAVGGGRPPRAADQLIDHGAGVLAPVLVNAHTHLELGALRGKVPCQNGFQPWVAELLRQRAALTQEEIQDGIQDGVTELLGAGCAVIGEISTLGYSWDPLRKSGLQGIYFEELLGSSPSGLATCRPAQGGFQGSLAAHAPHTTAPRLLRAVKAATRDKGLPMSLHLSESADEMEFITTATGPWAAFLTERGIDFSDWGLPAPSPVAHLDRLGILDERTLAVHLLHADRKEFALLAQRGVPVCLCLRSNVALHDRLPDLEAMMAAHLSVCLGTDSLASVPSLSLWAEMRLAANRYPGVSPPNLLAMVTCNPARALGLGNRFGTLSPGRLPAMVHLPLTAESPAALLETMVHGEGR
jgi:cytosine/adenosine deaminase-related metal-dependent hydrolase